MLVFDTFVQGWRRSGGRGGYSFLVGEPSPPVGENLTIRRGMNVRNDMKLSNFDGSYLLVALYSNPPVGVLNPCVRELLAPPMLLSRVNIYTDINQTS